MGTAPKKKTSAQRKQAVAVIPLLNNTQSKGLDFLSPALSDAIGNAVTQSQDFRQVERAQLKAVLKELELQQSGLTDDGTLNLQSAKVPAELIIGGSYIGNAAEITVTIRAIDVSSATVVLSRRVQAPIEQIFTKVSETMPVFLALLSGKNLAEISVVSEPQGAAVYINGNPVGETPVLGLKMPEGTYELRVVKKDFKDIEQILDLKTDEKRRIDIQLVESSYRRRIYWDFMGSWFIPLSNFSKNVAHGALGLGQAYGRFLIHLEGAMSTETQYTYSYSIPYSRAEDTRNYSIYMLHAGINYHIIDDPVFAPYIGKKIGYTRILESNINKSLYGANNDQRIMDGLTGMAIAGIDFFPAAAMHFFVEMRYYYSFTKMERSEVTNIPFVGIPQIADRSFFLSVMSFGVGIRGRF